MLVTHLPLRSYACRCLVASTTMAIVLSQQSLLYAQSADESAGDSAGDSTGDSTDDSYEEVIVTGRQQQQPFRTGKSSLELTGDKLRVTVSNTLGETLAMQPGVHNASFGPGVGLPVLRGLSGVRVRVLEDNIGTWDASALSPDHANAIEPVLAERIDVLHGATTVQYGSAAIGGVVAVDTRRIPVEKAGKPLSASLESRKEWVNDHRQTTNAAKLDLENEYFGFHVDGFKRDHDNVGIPGCAIDTEAVNAQFGFDASPSNSCHYVGNSDATADGFAIGSAFTGQRFYIGTSLRQLNYNYGIPPGSHTEPRDSGHNHQHSADDEEPFIRINMDQRRYDVVAGLSLHSDTWNRLELLVANIDYEHIESENNAPGTLFKNKVTEAKLQLNHTLATDSQGVAGIHIIDRSFSATGIENFVPPSDIDNYGLFFVEKFAAGAWTYQFGARLDYSRIEQKQPTAALRPNNIQLLHSPIRHKTSSVQLSADYQLNALHRLSVALGNHQRAPDVQEILALGPHLATRSYAIGLLIRGDNGQPNEPPDAEIFNSIEVSWQWQHRWGEQQLQLFYNAVDNFIYQRNTGTFYDLAEQSFRNNCVRLAECLPVYEYSQQDATLRGFEWQWQLPRWQTTAGFWELRLFSDYVRGHLDNGDDIPRMPSWRYGLAIDWWRGNWSADVRTTHIARQDKPGEFETMTERHHQLNASLRYRIHWGGADAMFFLRGKNLTDEEIRNATSFMRNFSPEAGRSVEIGMRWDW